MNIEFVCFFSFLICFSAQANEGFQILRHPVFLKPIEFDFEKIPNSTFCLKLSFGVVAVPASTVVS